MRHPASILRRSHVVPAGPPPAATPPATFTNTEKSESQANDPAKATQLLPPLGRHPAPAIRAAALLRLGRNLRKAGQIESAIQAYHELARLGSTRISGLPP